MFKVIFCYDSKIKIEQGETMRIMIQILLVSMLTSCHSASVNNFNADKSNQQPERTNYSYKSERSPTAENNQQGQICDLSQDRCSSRELSQEQTVKSIFLTDEVEKQLDLLEAQEKQQGRNFKVAIIGRMGSNLSKFQPLRDVNKIGQPVTLKQMVGELVLQSKDIRKTQSSFLQNNPYGIDYNNTLEPVLVQSWFDRTRKLKYSHLGIAIKNLPLKDEQGQLITGGDTGRWAVVQLLYSCEDGRKSHLFKGTVGNFFYDHMYDYGAQILIPSQKLQNNLEKIIVSNYLGKNWLETQYNALALADDLDQQNSNQWVLEVIAAAMAYPSEVKDRVSAQNYLRQNQFTSTKVTPTGLYSAIKIPFVAKMISSIMPTVCMTHQETIRKYGIGEIISALSIQEYLEKNKQLVSASEVELTTADKEELTNAVQTKKNKTNNKHLIKGQY